MDEKMSKVINASLAVLEIYMKTFFFKAKENLVDFDEIEKSFCILNVVVYNMKRLRSL